MDRNKPRIGLSACFFHADDQRPIFKGKTLLYLEESMGYWLMRHDAIPVLIPRPHAKIHFKDLLDSIDGLIFQGGADMAPTSYGEKPLNTDWAGDAIRDRYEIDLLKAFMDFNRPVLGICRGAQILNVAFGGTLYQDIVTQNEKAQTHRDWEVYDQLVHKIDFEPGSLLQNLYPQGKKSPQVNSVHHQGIKDLATDLIVEARSLPDKIIEAVRYRPAKPFIYGVQWHPEFQKPGGPNLLDPTPLLDYFLNEVRKNR